MEWISVNDERPKIGQKVILFSNVVVQQDIYMYDQGDINDYEVSTFWSRDDLDECPILKDDVRPTRYSKTSFADTLRKEERLQLILGDCLEKMKDIPDKSVDMILCDLQLDILIVI